MQSDRGEPARIDFYTGILGLRLAKITVHFHPPHVSACGYGAKTGRLCIDHESKELQKH
jgi:catechol 2,3-dioxygenase-like lactoylglutathione lyase family enzyme